MTEPFKNLINPALVQAAAVQLARHGGRRFDRQAFVDRALPGLEALEMKARMLQICAALQASLPADFDHAAGLIEAALAPLRPAPPSQLVRPDGEGLAGWVLWPVGEFVARQGQQVPQRALQLLHALTQRFSAEFAIRPFIVHHPALVFATLQHWTQDPAAAVRRLVSEGSRPRLPWGQRLDALVADPSPTRPLLLALQDDACEDVRRSVANHLNDIAKDHPADLADWLQQHLPGASAERRALLRHASRSLIKAGDRRVLAAWGLDQAFQGAVTLRLEPIRLPIGDRLVLQLHLRSTATRRQKLAIDYAVHHVKADGRRTPKVFKGWVIELGPGETRALRKLHSMRVVTTRRYHPGPHLIDVRINGRSLAEAGFELLPGAPVSAAATGPGRSPR